MDRSTGIISRLAGSSSGNRGYSGDGGDSLNARLYYPRGLALDSFRNLYIVDAVNYCIRKITRSINIISTVAGRGSINSNDPTPAISLYISYPCDLAIATDDNIYFSVVDSQSCVKLLTVSTGIATTFAGDCLQPLSSFSILYKPVALLYSSTYQALFIGDYGHHCIKYALTTGASAGQLVTIAGQCNVQGYAGQ
jgi:hypothetical protein